MTIKYRGYLKNNNQLKRVDESRLEKMAIGWIDYLFVFLIILYPLTKSLKLLISKYNGKILNVFLIDILGFIIAIIDFCNICKTIKSIDFKNDRISFKYYNFRSN